MRLHAASDLNEDKTRRGQETRDMEHGTRNKGQGPGSEVQGDNRGWRTGDRFIRFDFSAPVIRFAISY